MRGVFLHHGYFFFLSALHSGGVGERKKGFHHSIRHSRKPCDIFNSFVWNAFAEEKIPQIVILCVCGGGRAREVGERKKYLHHSIWHSRKSCHDFYSFVGIAFAEEKIIKIMILCVCGDGRARGVCEREKIFSPFGLAKSKTMSYFYSFVKNAFAEEKILQIVILCVCGGGRAREVGGRKKIFSPFDPE